VPTLSGLLALCADAAAWLAASPSHIVAFHCKAGKGRTGVAACALALFLLTLSPPALAASALGPALAARIGGGGPPLPPPGELAEGVMAWYAAGRTSDGSGVTIPSQRRCVQRFAELLAAAAAAAAGGGGAAAAVAEAARRAEAEGSAAVELRSVALAGPGVRRLARSGIIVRVCALTSGGARREDGGDGGGDDGDGDGGGGGGGGGAGPLHRHGSLQLTTLASAAVGCGGGGRHGGGGGICGASESGGEEEGGGGGGPAPPPAAHFSPPLRAAGDFRVALHAARGGRRLCYAWLHAGSFFPGGGGAVRLVCEGTRAAEGSGGRQSDGAPLRLDKPARALRSAGILSLEVAGAVV